jgi:hypothetical protein
VEGGMVNKDEGEGIWLMTSYTKQNNETSCNYFKWGREGEIVGGGNLTNVQCKSIWNCHNEFPSVQ